MRTDRRPLAELARADDGVALIEFAFVAPILLLLIVSALELANFGLAHLRVSQIAMTVADNAGREAIGIDEANVYEVFAGAEVIGDPIDFEAKGRVILSSLEHNNRNGSDAGQFVRWQRCFGDLQAAPSYAVEGDGQFDGSLADGLGAGSHRIASQRGTAVMFVEAVYDYTPLIASDLVAPSQIRYESAFNVRGRENQVITNANNLTVMRCN